MITGIFQEQITFEASSIIFKEMQAQKMTQTKLSKLSGLSMGCISRLFNGNAVMTQEKADKLGDALGIEIEAEIQLKVRKK